MPDENRSRPLWPAALLLVIPLWIAVDLYGPQKTDFRNFNPNEVARRETAMWRSYYAGERLRLFSQLADLLRAEYHLPFLRSHLAAGSATRAAFIFQKGSSESEYRQALPYLGRYFIILRGASKTDFDPIQTTQLELECWIIHRERAKHAPGDLERAIAAAASELYEVPAQRLMEYARLRTRAMLLRDDKAQRGMTEADWNKIDELLRESWQALHQAVNS